MADQPNPATANADTLDLGRPQRDVRPVRRLHNLAITDHELEAVLIALDSASGPIEHDLTTGQQALVRGVMDRMGDLRRRIALDDRAYVGRPGPATADPLPTVDDRDGGRNDR